jgi:hypothetical protein
MTYALETHLPILDVYVRAEPIGDKDALLDSHLSSCQTELTTSN